MSQASSMSGPYRDGSDLVATKTDIQLYWDCPSPTTDRSERASTTSTLNLKSLTESFSRTFTAIVVPHRVRSQSDGGHSEDEEVEPLIS